MESEEADALWIDMCLLGIAPNGRSSYWIWVVRGLIPGRPPPPPRTPQLPIPPLLLNNHHLPPSSSPTPAPTCPAPILLTPSIREWDYGSYEGLTSAQIRQHRLQSGIRGEGGSGAVGSWDIWKDGCEGGESPEDVTKRVDGLIGEIRERWHGPVFERKEEGKGEGEKGMRGDVVVVAHGHVLRAFAQRWVGKRLEEGVGLLLDGMFCIVMAFPCFGFLRSCRSWIF